MDKTDSWFAPDGVSFTMPITDPTVTIYGKDGTILFKLYNDGLVFAPDIESASEAGRVFIESMREALGLHACRVKTLEAEIESLKSDYCDARIER